MNKFTLFALLVLIFPAILFSQKEAETKKTKKATIDILPAISYAPETKLTLGVIGIYNRKFTKDAPTTKMSNLQFLAVYTLAKQILLETRGDIFTSANKWRFRGEMYFNKYPDRNYGLGNTASAHIEATDEDGEVSKVNYKQYSSNRIKFSPSVLRKINDNLYVGLQLDMESLDKVESIPVSEILLNEAAMKINDLPVDGFRSGVGGQLLFDSRDFILNPLTGGFVEVNALLYNKAFGSDWNFSNLLIDGRKYFNPVANHTLAVRGYFDHRFSDDLIPIRALARVGGKQLVRGYFKGTYQDHNMTAFELEYRMPFWKEDDPGKLYQVWKRLGIVAFLSGAKTYHKIGDFGDNKFNLAAGAGLRILFNPKTRAAIRIDYAFGLADDSAGPGEKQSGLYFYLGEAF
ncbi:MAG: BamA/TamA family outer membrane protein [Bacteroidetes bacterium]|nr:BamA/TamA family outer membrane protein [Bacteroidota bacterium]